MPARHLQLDAALMTPERWEQIKRLFHAALEYEPAQRPAFFVRTCADDVPLRHEVESLLASHEQAESFIEEPAADVAAALLDEDQPGLVAGQMVGPFRIQDVLATGGMGEVYLADDTRLGRKIALKLLPLEFTINVDRVSRFGREACAASALNHPNIVTIHEIGQAGPLHFIATEFIDGVTLRGHMTNTPMTVGEVLDVAGQIASALQAAHDAGIIHRDVKPENIMLRRDGIVKVLDFGLAKLTPQQAVTAVDVEGSKSLAKTNPGVVMGTVRYMSPEQARGQEVDARTDVWSLGVVLYEMSAGRAPFAGETPSHVIVSILESEPPLLARHAGVPAELERIVSKALRKERTERYQTAGDLALDLKRLKEELTVESRLKQLRRSNAQDWETATASKGQVARNTAHASWTSTAEVAMAHLTSSAEYMVKRIKRHKGSTVFASVTVFFLISSLLYFFNTAKRGSDSIDSVAVLPFVNVSGDPNTEYLSDGISDSVITSLSRLPALRVTSLNSVLRYKGKQIDPKAVGRELNVRAILMGRMTLQGEGLVISTELVDVSDNRRLWGEQYNRKLSGIFVVQNDIAGEIAQKLRLRLGSADVQRLTKPYTENTDAYHAYLKGRYFLDKRTGATAEKSIQYLEQAVKLDPNFASAYATLSYAYWSSNVLRGRPRNESLPQAKAAAAKALELDDMLAEAHAALGLIRVSDRDWAGAERAFKRALEIDANSALAHAHYAGYLRTMKRSDEAVTESKRALELEPVSVPFNIAVAAHLYYARRYDEAIEQCQKSLELDPNMPSAYRWLAKSYEQKGLHEQAVAAWLKTEEFTIQGPEAGSALKEAYTTSGWQGFWRKVLVLKKERAKHGNVSPYTFAETYARLGETDQTFSWLEKAYEVEDSWMNNLNTDPLWDNLRSDPRFSDLLRRMNFEP